MLVGGIAVGYYGYPRATGDIDLWVDNGPENAKADKGDCWHFCRCYGKNLESAIDDCQ